jgi:alkylation response protein AidB-like acyl-CoA dehydrogenase
VDLEFEEHQIELGQAAAELLANECPPAIIRAVIDGTGDALVEGLWKTLGSLDWPLLTIPEADGGMGMTAVDLGIVCEQLGYVADPTPFVATTSQFIPAVVNCAGDEQRGRFLAPIASGGTGTLAASALPGAELAVAATPNGDSWTLSGTVEFVVDGDRADEIAVLADGPEGTEVFVVPGHDPRTARTHSFDATLHIAEACFDGVEVPEERRLVGGPGSAANAVEEAATAMALVVVGACQRALDMVVEYAKEREQFGKPIAEFQAIQWKIADMQARIDAARLMVRHAAWMRDRGERCSQQAAEAKLLASTACNFAADECLQIHGGAGYTDHFPVERLFRDARITEIYEGATDIQRLVIARHVLA